MKSIKFLTSEVSVKSLERLTKSLVDSRLRVSSIVEAFITDVIGDLGYCP